MFYDKNEKKYREKTQEEIQQDLSLLQILDDNENGDCDQTIPLEKRNNGNKDDYNNNIKKDINCKHQDNNIYQKDKPENNNISINDKNNNTDMKKNLSDEFNNTSKKHLYQNGFLQLKDNVLFYLIDNDNEMTITDIKVYLLLLKQSIGFQRKWWKIDYDKIISYMAISKKHIYKVIKRLSFTGHIEKKGKYVSVNMDKMTSDKKGFVNIPDKILYNLISKEFITTKRQMKVILYVIKRTMGYAEYECKEKVYYTDSFKKVKKLDKKQIDVFKEWFYLKNGYNDIIESTGIGKTHITNVLKELSNKGIIEIEKSDYIWIKFIYDTREWNNEK